MDHWYGGSALDYRWVRLMTAVLLAGGSLVAISHRPGHPGALAFAILGCAWLLLEVYAFYRAMSEGQTFWETMKDRLTDLW